MSWYRLWKAVLISTCGRLEDFGEYIEGLGDFRGGWEGTVMDKGDTIGMGGGGSCMVRVGLLFFLPMAATRELNLEDELSLDFDVPLEAVLFMDCFSLRLVAERFIWRGVWSFEGFERDHQDLWDDGGAVDMAKRKRDGMSVKMRVADEGVSSGFRDQ